MHTCQNLDRVSGVQVQSYYFLATDLEIFNRKVRKGVYPQSCYAELISVFF